MDLSSQSLWMYITIFIMSVVTAIAVSISFYLYRWRRIILSQPSAVVPEEWAKYLKEVGSSLDLFGTNMSKSINSITLKTADNTNNIKDMISTFMTLQNALDEKDAEIKRLKSGYDTYIFRNYLIRFIRINQFMEECIDMNDYSHERLEQFNKLFEDALDECGVEKYSPSIGVDYRYAQGINDNPKVMLTNEVDLDFKVAEVIEAGYKLRSGDSFEYIVTAKVKIYKYHDGGK